jgi:Na+/H+ antiporter NhaC
MTRPKKVFTVRFWIGIIVIIVGTGIEHFFQVGYTPIWPSLLALFLAIIWRRIVLALAIGVAAGTILASDRLIPVFFIEDVLAPVVTSSWNLTVIAFTLLCGGFAGLIQLSGGLESLALRLAGKSGDARGFELSAFVLGIVCFFDGLANSLIVGRTLRPLADRLGVSREKLAYIADSTSAPIACLALATTWVATQLGLIRDGLEAAGLEASAHGVLIQSIPANFYCWTALFLVPLSIGFRWNPGAMRETIAYTQEANHSTPTARDPWRSLVPIVVFVISLIVGLFIDGLYRAPEGSSFYTAFSYANAATILLLAVLLSIAASIVCLHREERTRAFPALWSGIGNMIYPLLILAVAWMLGATLRDLETAEFLAGLLGERLPEEWFPLLVFALACVIAYTTGTSWGTMALTLPPVIPLAASLGNETALIPVSVAAALSGAVFGDHTSPFSDTTIISAAASGCDPWDHVRTQWPYALTAAGIAALAGFLPVGFGLPAWLGLATCLLSLYLFVSWKSGRRLLPVN